MHKSRMLPFLSPCILARTCHKFLFSLLWPSCLARNLAAFLTLKILSPTREAHGTRRTIYIGLITPWDNPCEVRCPVETCTCLRRNLTWKCPGAGHCGVISCLAMFAVGFVVGTEYHCVFLQGIQCTHHFVRQRRFFAVLALVAFDADARCISPLMFETPSTQATHTKKL